MLNRPVLPTVAAPSQPVATLAFLGPPPLVEGEQGAAYDELFARVSGALQPKDILEEIWIRDVVDLVWDVLRLRRVKANLLSYCTNEGVAAAMQRLGTGNVVELIREWTMHDAPARQAVAATLASAGLTVETAGTRSLAFWITDLERIERMIASAEARRHAALRELERHRATLAQSLRRAVAEVEDAEFKVITPDGSAQEAGA
jgi:hypothetical protein